MKPVLHLVVAAAFITSACAGNSGAPDAPVEPPRIREAAGPESERLSPPALLVTSDDGHQVEIQPHAYCWSGRDVSLCADGDPWYFGSQTLAGTTSFSLEWPLDGWSWTVEARTESDQCDVILPRLTNQVEGQPIAAPAQGELVFVTGRGPQGDASFAFHPAFTSAGGVPRVSATMSFAGPNASPVDASGLAVWIANVPTEPESFSASVFMQDINGRVGQFELKPATRGNCWSGNLIASIDPDAEGVALTGFQVPISLSVDIVMDGVAFRSEQVVWPDAFRTNSDQSPNLVLNLMGAGAGSSAMPAR